MRDARAFRVFYSITHLAYFWLKSLYEIASKILNKSFADVENTSTPVPLPFAAEIILSHYNCMHSRSPNRRFPVPRFSISSPRARPADPSKAEAMTMAVIECAAFGEFHIPEFGPTPPRFDA
jgi:hypothetical protein